MSWVCQLQADAPNAMIVEDAEAVEILQTVLATDFSGLAALQNLVDFGDHMDAHTVCPAISLARCIKGTAVEGAFEGIFVLL